MPHNRRKAPLLRWQHRAIAEWELLQAGESRPLHVPVGGYLLVRKGRVEVRSIAANGAFDGPQKLALGGGDVVVRAETEAEIAEGTVESQIAVVLDPDAGWATELWSLIGLNRRALRTVDYRQGRTK